MATALDLDALARLGGLELLARTVVEGHVLGRHRSPFRGFSAQFSEYRPYVPGDELRRIDWKVYARTDRHYVKQYEEETNLACHIVLDCSASMDFPRAASASSAAGPVTKFAYAARLAGCLAYLLARQRDAVGLVLFDRDVREILPPRLRPGHLRRLLSALERAAPAGETHIAGPLHALASSLGRRGMVILISDLLDDPEAVLAALRHFSFRGHDVVVLQVMDDAELRFDFARVAHFVDLETGASLRAAPASAREGYLARLAAFLGAYARGCPGLGADYRLFNTREPLERALAEYLRTRNRRV